MATNKKTSVRRAPSKTSKPKSRVGGSSLAKSSKSTLFTKRNGLIVAALAAVAGVVAVAFSFASGVPKYQYSLTSACAGSKAAQSCKDDSAEGMAYRVYKAVYGKAPSAAEYAAMVQNLAGDRTRPEALPAIASGLNTPFVTDQTYVDQLFANALGRTSTSTTVADKNVPAPAYGKEYVSQLKAKKRTRAQIAVIVAASKEAKVKNKTAFNTYVAAATPVKVVQTARAAQKDRYYKMAGYRKWTTNNAKNAASYNDTVKRAAVAAKRRASKAKPSKDDLAFIFEQLIVADKYISKTGETAKIGQSFLKITLEGYENAKDVLTYATDIGSDPQIGLAHTRALVMDIQSDVKKSDAYAQNLQKYKESIAASYAAAKAKREAELGRVEAEKQRLAAEAVAQQRASETVDDSSTITGTTTGATTQAITGKAAGDTAGVAAGATAGAITGKAAGATAGIAAGTTALETAHDRYPQYTLCKNKADGQWRDFRYWETSLLFMNRKYYMEYRYVVCDHGGEKYVGGWIGRTSISQKTYMNGKKKYEKGLHRI